MTSLSPNILYDVKILLGLTSIILILIINTQIPILPISNIAFLLTSISLWFTSLSATFFCLHKLLQQKEPLQFFCRNKVELEPKRRIQPNPEKVRFLADDINKYFISKWYSNISQNEEFVEQSKVLLEELIVRLVEVQVLVSNKLLLHGSLNLFLKHLKEFRRSLKRKEKYGGKIEDLYRYSHMCSNSSKKAKDYFLHQLTTNLLRHFINSELWNSLPCSILVAVLSRKLTSYLLSLISNPNILNYIVLNVMASDSIREKYDLKNYARINVIQFFDVIDSSPKKVGMNFEQTNLKNVECPCVTSINNEESKLELKPITEIMQNDDVKTDHKIKVEVTKESIRKGSIVLASEKKMDIKDKKIDNLPPDSKEHTAPVPKCISSDPVKIYEPKITKSNRTWRDSKDLGLGISLGQDPLDALPVAVESVKSFGKSTFWDTDKLAALKDTTKSAALEDRNPDSSTLVNGAFMQNQVVITGKIEHFVEDSSAHLLSEMKHTTQTTMEGLKSSMKPLSDATVNTLHNIKDLQETTVNNALHKIGDFQDEAASMVEGIFDLGKAGFRKGLRLTGLQDNIENAKATLNVGHNQTKSQTTKKKVSKTARVETPEKSMVAEECLDTVWMNPLTMDSPNFDGQILLEKSSEKPFKSVDKEERELQIPFISMEEPNDAVNSPDPEYEDAADLASSIAKLRSLLQQRSSESSMSTPALSPMPPDDPDQKNAETESVSDMEEMDGFMPSFYKFCAKTATGVLDKTIHTIKTALPGTAQGIESNDNAWIFVQTDQNEPDILTRMKKLLTERKEYCTVDTEIDAAYEAIDSLDAFQQTSFASNVDFEDELDDFEVKLPITKCLVDILCELLSDTETPLIQEPVIKAVLLGLGYSIENSVISTADRIMDNFCENLLTIPEKSNQKTLIMDLEDFVEAILNSLPELLKLALGKTTLTKALTLLVSSMQNQKVNEDVILQIFELISLKLIEESSQISPPASA